MAVVNGVIYTPAYSLPRAAEAFALSQHHVGYRYGTHTELSFSFDDEVGFAYTTEDTGQIPQAPYLLYGAANSANAYKFGGTSLFLPVGAKFDIPTGTNYTHKVNQYDNFTLECWIYKVSGGGDSSLLAAGTVGILWLRDGYIASSLDGGSGFHAVATNTWHHIALSRKSNICRFFVDGELKTSWVSMSQFELSSIGTSGTSHVLYIDSFGFAPRYCHWDDTFVLPTRPFYFRSDSSGAIVSMGVTSIIPGDANGSFLTATEYDPLWNDVALLVRGAGEDSSTNIFDDKYNNFKLVGGVRIAGNGGPFGNSCIDFRQGGWLTAQGRYNLDFMFGDFTIEVWVKPTASSSHTILAHGGADGTTAYRFYFDADRIPKFAFTTTVGTGYTLTAPAAIALDTWAFLCVSRTGDAYRIWSNGLMGSETIVAEAPSRWGSAMYDLGGYAGEGRLWDVPVNIGVHHEVKGIGQFKGYMSDLRVTNGKSRYTSSGTVGVPVSAFVPTGSGTTGDPFWGDVTALVHFDEPHGAVNFREARGHTVTRETIYFVGSNGYSKAVYASNENALFGNALNGSVSFVGSDVDLATGDFTLEFSLYGPEGGTHLAHQMTSHDVQGSLRLNGTGWTIQNIGGPDYNEKLVGYVQWSQWDSNGVLDIAVSPMNVLLYSHWHHVAVQRKGNYITVFVDGQPGETVSISRRPHTTGVPIQVIAPVGDEVRLTRVARYPTAFRPHLTKYPEVPYVFGNSIITETYRVVPGEVGAASQVPGATFGYSFRLQIPKVVAPVVPTTQGLLPASATGGEGAGEALGVSEHVNLSQSFRDSDSFVFGDDAFVQFVAGAMSGFEFGDEVSITLANVGVSEYLDFAGSLTAVKKSTWMETANLAFDGQQGVAIGIQATGNVAVSGALTMARNVLTQTRIAFDELVGSQFTFTIIQQEGIALADEDPAFSFGAEASDQFALSASADRSKRVVPVVVETTGFHDDAKGGLHVTLVVPEGLGLSDAMTPAQQLALIVSESVQLSDFFSSPAFTTWVMNTRTTAVSEYDDFRFNSFAQVGERYLGANETGLYWLDGDTDNTQPIQAVIQPGVVQPHGNKLANVTSAYLGMRGNGSFVITVTDEAGGSYDYPIDVESMKTGRVKFGKGLRTRYMTFRIVSSGGDFDLDNIEFITSETSRKVQR